MVRARLALLSVMLAGCSPLRVVKSDAPPFDAREGPPLGAVEICVVRPHSLGFATTLPVRDGGVLVGATRGPSYFCYRAAPGRHRLVSGGGSLTLDVTPGQRQFVHQAMLPRRLVAVDAARGQAMLARCAYLLVADAPDDDAPPDPEAVVPTSGE